MAKDFWGPMIGLNRNETSVANETAVELKYQRIGANSLNWKGDAGVELVVGISFIRNSGGSRNSDLEALSLDQVDNLINALQAAKERARGLMHDGQSLHEMKENCHQYKLMLIERAMADARVQRDQYAAELNGLISGTDEKAKKFSARKRLSCIETANNLLSDAQKTITALENELKEEMVRYNA